MKATYIDYSETDSFTDGLISYIENDHKLAPFISYNPDLDGFKKLIEAKKQNIHREGLVKILKNQYTSIADQLTPSVAENIDLLAHKNTFTVTTGHQLNLFTGPLYFIFKIVTAINLAKELKLSFPDKNFIPVYWMATEDHDFAEINHAIIAGKKIEWTKEVSGATGKINTSGLEKALKEYRGILGLSENAKELGKIMTDAYAHNSNLADASRYLVNALFGDYGLVILDADEPELKKQFASVIQEDIIHQHSFKHIEDSNKKLAEIGIDAQVNPREINFFYLNEGIRERIVYKNESYEVLNTEISFSPEEIKLEISNHPERFSPNVMMRPLYQEFILPNLAYIGGGAEIIYWLQLKQVFDHYSVDFPVLLLRNSALFTIPNLGTKLKRLDLSIRDIFTNTEDLKKSWVLKHSEHNLNLKDEWQELSCIFEKIKLRSYKIDATLAPSTEAVKARLQKAVKNLEAKLIKAEKRNYADALSQIDAIKTKLFPNGGLQERSENFGLYYVKYGKGFIKTLIENFRPLDLKFTIFEE